MIDINSTGLAGRVADLTTVLEAPFAGEVAAGCLLRILRADGSEITYRALRPFTWSAEFDHVYKADPELVKVSERRARSVAIPTPTGFTAPPFTVERVGPHRVRTSLDDPHVYRETFLPAPAQYLHVDNVAGSNGNSGATRALAKSSLISGAVTAANAAGTNALIYLYNAAGPTYDRHSGLRHDSQLTVNHGVIGVPDAEGNPPILSNSYGPADASWAANASHAHVWEAGTGTMSQPGRVFDRTVPRFVTHHVSGRTFRLPLEYARKTSLAEVAALPGSYWFDSANAKFYVNRIGGGAPTLGDDILITRSVSSIILGASELYYENVIFLSGVQVASSGAGSRAHFSDCVFLGARGSGCYTTSCESIGTRNCIVLDSELDGLNYHDDGGLGTVTFHEINPMVIGTDVFDAGGSMQCSTAHDGVKGWTVNPHFAGSHKDNITDIQTTERIVYGGYLGPGRAGGAGDQGHVFAGVTSKIALYDVAWDGRLDTAGPIFDGNATHAIKMLHTELPFDANQWSEVSAAW
ncbi:hypothetical protein [Marinovum sp.]|uniref:hypothetical protein n=1 Tax=Marinovum sp. TaxID=2024839 RepID=UPI002B2674D7|nr:hypothetical protein [Marinovum sp.]